MMNRVRKATEEEIEKIKSFSDLSGCSILALDTPQGPILGVLRTAIEVDPVIYPEALPDRWKLIFQRDVETVLAAQGVPKYYFNLHASNEEWNKEVKKWGAIPQSTEPEIRYVKVL